MSDFRTIETGVMRECGICNYKGTATDHIGQCPCCGWDELSPPTDGAKLREQAKRMDDHQEETPEQ